MTDLAPTDLPATERPETPAPRDPAEAFRHLIPNAPERPLHIGLNTEQPACPLCSAPARDGHAYARYDDLEHNCNCDRDATGPYYLALRTLWANRRRLPDLLAQIPERFHGARAQDYLGSPVPMALCSRHSSRFIYGDCGTGKTHLTAAVGLAAARRGVSVAYWPVNVLMDRVREAVRLDLPRPDLSYPDLVILDDLAKLKPTDFSYEVLYGVIADRWARDRATLYTANADALTTARAVVPATMFPTPEGREGAAQALASRMCAGGEYAVTGHDRRARTAH